MPRLGGLNPSVSAASIFYRSLRMIGPIHGLNTPVTATIFGGIEKEESGILSLMHRKIEGPPVGC